MTTAIQKEAERTAQFWYAVQLENALQAVVLLRALDHQARKAVMEGYVNDDPEHRRSKIVKACQDYRDRLLKQLTYVPQMPADHQD